MQPKHYSVALTSGWQQPVQPFLPSSNKHFSGWKRTHIESRRQHTNRPSSPPTRETLSHSPLQQPLLPTSSSSSFFVGRFVGRFLAHRTCISCFYVTHTHRSPLRRTKTASLCDIIKGYGSTGKFQR